MLVMELSAVKQKVYHAKSKNTAQEYDDRYDGDVRCRFPIVVFLYLAPKFKPPEALSVNDAELGVHQDRS